MFKEKLMAKLAKKGKELDPLEKAAKLGVVKELSSQAGSMMGEKMNGLKKGLSESDASLEHPAENSVAEHTGSPAMGEPGDGDSNPDEMSEYEDCSPEELDEKIKALQDLKSKKESQNS